MVKALLVIIFGVLALIVSAVLLIPVFFDANKHVKPYIEKAISQNLNVDAKIGRLSISLWGKGRVQVLGLELVDRRNSQSVFKVDDAVLEAPLLPILSKVLDLQFVARQPEIN